MNKLKLDNIGGLPFDQDVLAFMQDSYGKPFGAIAKLCGDKTILHGVELVGGNVTNGWIAYNGELLPFIGAAAAAQVLITEQIISYVFESSTSYPVEFKRQAELVNAGGTFPFSDLVPLLSLKNIWKKDDIRTCMKDNAYVTANFDAITGIGINEEVGWILIDKVYSDAAGRAFVNRNIADAKFDEAGKLFGNDEEILVKDNLPSSRVNLFTNSVGAGDLPTPVGTVSRAGSDNGDFKYELKGGPATEPTLGVSSKLGDDVPHNNIQKSMAVLTLLKL